MPPAGDITKGINSFTDEVRVLGCQFFCIEACNNAEEGEITLLLGGAAGNVVMWSEKD